MLGPRQSARQRLHDLAARVMEEDPSNRQMGMCRQVARQILGGIRADPGLARGISVVTIYYQDDQNDCWDHTVASVCIPGRFVVDARINYLSDESAGGDAAGGPMNAALPVEAMRQMLNPKNVEVFVGSLTAWQREVERRTGCRIVDYGWSHNVPDDDDVRTHADDISGQRRATILLGLHRPSRTQRG